MSCSCRHQCLCFSSRRRQIVEDKNWTGLEETRHCLISAKKNRFYDCPHVHHALYIIKLLLVATLQKKPVTLFDVSFSVIKDKWRAVIGASTLRTMRSDTNSGKLNFGLLVDQSYKILNLLLAGAHLALAFKPKVTRWLPPTGNDCDSCLITLAQVTRFPVAGLTSLSQQRPDLQTIASLLTTITLLIWKGLPLNALVTYISSKLQARPSSIRRNWKARRSGRYVAQTLLLTYPSAAWSKFTFSCAPARRQASINTCARPDDGHRRSLRFSDRFCNIAHASALCYPRHLP